MTLTLVPRSELGAELHLPFGGMLDKTGMSSLDVLESLMSAADFIGSNGKSPGALLDPALRTAESHPAVDDGRTCHAYFAAHKALKKIEDTILVQSYAQGEEFWVQKANQDYLWDLAWSHNDVLLETW